MTRVFALAVCLFPLVAAAQTTVNVNNGQPSAYGPAVSSVNCPTVAAPPPPVYCPTPAAPAAEYVVPQPMTYTAPPATTTYTYSAPAVRSYTYSTRTYAAPPPMFPELAYRSRAVSARPSLLAGCLGLLGLHRHARKAARLEAKAARLEAKAAYHEALAEY